MSYGQNRNDDYEKPLGTNDWKTLFPKDHLTAVDLWNEETGKYRTVPVTIDRVVLKGLFDEHEKKKIDKPVIFFKGKEKYMILNIEISKQLVDITGSPDPAKWIGKEVEVYIHIGRQTPQGKMDVPRLRKPGNMSARTENRQQQQRPSPAPEEEWAGPPQDEPPRSKPF